MKELGISIVADLPVGDNLQDHYSTGMSFVMEYPIGVETPVEFSPGYILEYGINKNNSLTNNIGEGTAFLKTKYVDPNIDYPDVQLFFIPGKDCQIENRID